MAMGIASSVIVIMAGNSFVLNSGKTAMIKALIKYQDSKWDYNEVYDIVNSGTVKSIDVSSILEESNDDGINITTDSIIKSFEGNIKLLDEQEASVASEKKVISNIENAINNELEADDRQLANSLVKKANLLTKSEKELLDLYIGFYSSKIVLTNNTKDLAIKKISVDEYNGFEKKRKDLLKNTAVEERRLLREMKELSVDIDDSTYRLLLALEK